MTEKIDYPTQMLFGTSSEKSKTLEGQYSLFNEGEQAVVSTNAPESVEAISVKEHFRKRKGIHDDTFKGVPVRDEIIPFYVNLK